MMLEYLGYEVLSATSPSEAIRLAEERGQKIHLLFTDIIMPEMNGWDLAQRIREVCPLIRNLFTSGYTATVIAHRGVIDEGVPFIQKPFSVKGLASKIGEILGGT